MPTHPVALLAVTLVFGATVALLAPHDGLLASIRRFVVGALACAALMGLGSVFGKVLGDFLRGAG